MKTSFYLVATSSGTIRACKKKPDLSWDEVSVLVDLSIPDLLFKRPVLVASISVPETAAHQFEISPEFTDNLKEYINTSTGVELKISVIKQEDQP